MSDKSAKPPASQSQTQGWRPRVDEEEEFNAFANTHRAPDSAPAPQKIRDATEDTAPLQGSMDQSDDDSLTTGGSASGPRKP